MAFQQGIMTKAWNQLFSDNKRSVTLYKVTRTESPMTGTKELTYDSGTSVELVFFKTDVRFQFGMEGLIEFGDCLVFDKPNNNNLAQDDKIVVDGETFLIKKRPIQWKSRDLHVFTAASGYKI